MQLERRGPIVDEARAAREALREETQRLAGPLRVSMPAEFGAFMVGPLLPRFAKAHPAVKLQLDLSPQFRDLVHHDFDLVLRMGALKGEGLISRRILWLQQGLFAAPG